MADTPGPVAQPLAAMDAPFVWAPFTVGGVRRSVAAQGAPDRAPAPPGHDAHPCSVGYM